MGNISFGPTFLFLLAAISFGLIGIKTLLKVYIVTDYEYFMVGMFFIVSAFLWYKIDNRPADRASKTQTFPKLSKKKKAREILKINHLLSLGENIKTDPQGPLHNGSVYVPRSMRKLRNGVLSLLRDFGYADDPIYHEVLNIPDIGPRLGPRELYATKRDFIDRHIEALNTVREHLAKSHPTRKYTGRKKPRR